MVLPYRCCMFAASFNVSVGHMQSNLFKLSKHGAGDGEWWLCHCASALAYKLRATDTAVIDTYTAAAHSHTGISLR